MAWNKYANRFTIDDRNSLSAFSLMKDKSQIKYLEIKFFPALQSPVLNLRECSALTEVIFGTMTEVKMLIIDSLPQLKKLKLHSNASIELVTIDKAPQFETLSMGDFSRIVRFAATKTPAFNTLDLGIKQPEGHFEEFMVEGKDYLALISGYNNKMVRFR